MEVYCPNKQKGCDKIIQYGSVQSHLNTVCLFEPVLCPNHTLGCLAKISRGEIAQHLDTACEFSIKCSCGHKVKHAKDQHASCMKKMLDDLKRVRSELEFYNKKIELLVEKEAEIEKCRAKFMENHAAAEKSAVAAAKPVLQKVEKQQQAAAMVAKAVAAAAEEKKVAREVKVPLAAPVVKPGRVVCKICSRGFAADRIAKHEAACAKAKNNNRGKFDSKSQRLGEFVVDDAAAEDLHNVPLAGKGKALVRGSNA